MGVTVKGFLPPDDPMFSEGYTIHSPTRLGLLSGLAASEKREPFKKAKALSIRQPFVGWILDGEKKIEVRTWSTSYRGPLILHASMTVDPGYEGPKEHVGAILGVADLVDVRPMKPGDAKLAKSPRIYRELFSWVLANPRRLNRPIPYKGRLGLFELPADVSQSVKELLA